jgi:hypothetical protein
VIAGVTRDVEKAIAFHLERAAQHDATAARIRAEGGDPNWDLDQADSNRRQAYVLRQEAIHGLRCCSRCLRLGHSRLGERECDAPWAPVPPIERVEPRPVTGPDGDNPITDEQCMAVSDVCGFAPGYRDFECPTCKAQPPNQCEGRVRKSHVARVRVGDRARAEWRARCAAAWNARQGGG